MIGGGSKKSKRTSTTTSSTTTMTTLEQFQTSTTTDSPRVTLSDRSNAEVYGEEVPTAIHEDTSWSSESKNSSQDSAHSISLSLLATEPPIELVVKPLTKVVLPCKLEANYSALLMSAVRLVQFFFNKETVVTFIKNSKQK